jgi:hypothetical protein
MASQNSVDDSIATVEYPDSSGASSATNESVLTQLYPQPSGADGEFRSVIVKIAKQLDARNRETISYLKCEELGPDGEEMSELAMLVKLEKAGLFHAQDTANLEALLGECDRHDLVNKYLKPYRRKLADGLAKENSPLDGEDLIY